MTESYALPPLGERVLWAMNQKNKLYLDIAELLNITGPVLLAKIRGQQNFSTLELAKLSEGLGVRTDAWFQPTWEEFIERQTKPRNELDELVLLLQDLGYAGDPESPEKMLMAATAMFQQGKIGVRVLMRYTRVLGTMIVGDDE